MRTFSVAVSAVSGGSGARFMGLSSIDAFCVAPAGEVTGAAGGVCHSLGTSHQLAGGDDGEVDVGLADYIDVVRPGVERDMEHDLDHLRIVVAGRLYGIDIVLSDMAVLTHDFDRKAHRGIRLEVVRSAVTVRGLQEFEPEPSPVSLIYTGQRHLPLKLRTFLDFAAPRLKARLSESA